MNTDSFRPNCGEIHAHLETYFDGEIRDPSLQTRIDEHVHVCRACREELHFLASARDRLRALNRPEAPPYLRARVETILAGPGIHLAGRVAALLLRRPIPAAVFAALLLSSLTWFLVASRNGFDEQTQVSALDVRVFVDDHLGYIPAAPDKEAMTPDPEALEAWLETRLEFSPRLPRWEWAALQSGRPCIVNGRQVAFIRYRCGGESVSLFIRPLEAAAEIGLGPANVSPRVAGMAEGQAVAVWRRLDREYVLVAPASMQNILDRIGNEV